VNDYLYDVDEAQYSFVRVPKLLLQHEAYQRISSEAKLLYSLLLDRVSLSHKNGWKDKQNRIYIIYPIAEVMEEMNCGKNKAVQLLDELEQKAGLIERKRQGLGKPNLIYVKSFSRTVDNFGERHFLKFENQTSGGLNIKPQEVSESNPTNTDNKKTDINQTDLSFLPGRESKRNDAYAQYEAYFREELEIPILIQGNRSEKETLEGILDLLAETCSSKRKTIRIAGDDKPIEIVKNRLMKLNSLHIQYVLDCLKENTTYVRDMKQYLLTTLFNAPVTIDSYYQATAGRPSKEHEGQVVPDFFGKRTTTIIGEASGDSYKQVQRFVRLTNLIPEILEMVDQKRIAFNPAVELSYLKPEEQKNLLEAIDFTQATPSVSQAMRLKKLSQEGGCKLEDMCEILAEVKKGDLERVAFKSEQLRKYFPKSYTPRQMSDVILKLLDQWQKKRQRDKAR